MCFARQFHPTYDSYCCIVVPTHNILDFVDEYIKNVRKNLLKLLYNTELLYQNPNIRILIRKLFSYIFNVHSSSLRCIATLEQYEVYA